MIEFSPCILNSVKGNLQKVLWLNLSETQLYSSCITFNRQCVAHVAQLMNIMQRILCDNFFVQVKLKFYPLKVKVLSLPFCLCHP